MSRQSSFVLDSRSHNTHTEMPARSLDKSLPKCLLTTIQPLLQYLVDSYSLSTSMKGNTSSITINFDLTARKPDRRHPPTTTRSADQPTPQVDLVNIAPRSTHAPAEEIVQQQTPPNNSPRYTAPMVNTAQPATPINTAIYNDNPTSHQAMDHSPTTLQTTNTSTPSTPTAAEPPPFTLDDIIRHSQLAKPASPPLPQLPNNDSPASSQRHLQLLKLAEKTHNNSQIVINVKNRHKREMYIITNQPPFKITKKNHATRESTPFTNWQPDDLLHFVEAHHDSLTTTQIQQLTSKFLLYSRPHLTHNMATMLEALITAPAKYFSEYC